MPDHLQVFFVVTTTSVYRVVAEGEDHFPYAEKIALRGESLLPVGHKICDGMMIAVAKCLQSYIPEGHSLLSAATSFERQLENVNTQWWKTGTSPIVALFLDEEGALTCFEQACLVPCDPRWLEQTKEVVAAIGDDHPTFTVCHYSDLALIPAV